MEFVRFLPWAEVASTKEGRYKEVGSELFSLRIEKRMRGITDQHFPQGDSILETDEERVLGEVRMPKDEEGIQLGSRRVHCEELVAL